MVDGMERLAELDELEQSLGGEYAGATLDDVDEDALRRSLGQDAVRDVRRLRQIERSWSRPACCRRRDGELVLTPRGARLLGEKALTALLDRVRRQPADHRRCRPRAHRPDATVALRGHRAARVQRTLSNAVMRQRRASGTGAQVEEPFRLRPDDLEVVEQEVRPATATALLLDLSFSMPLQGHFVPAKRMALALHALIEGKHRADSLYLVGFSDYARRLQPADLARAGFERVYGTNMQHAFLLARRLLAEDPREVKQVIMVTDGEPTAHLVGDEAIFNWPPVPGDAGDDAAGGDAARTHGHRPEHLPARGRPGPGGLRRAPGPDDGRAGVPDVGRGGRPHGAARLPLRFQPQTEWSTDGSS
jgi:uncharacterized protein with von Willebrand factor type A (vWA) domain